MTSLEMSLSHIQDYVSQTEEILKNGKVDLGFTGAPFVVDSQSLYEMAMIEMDFISENAPLVLREINLTEEKESIQNIVTEANNLIEEYKRKVL